MRFISTRDKNNIVTFGEAIFKGLAEDGGLFVPEGTWNLENLIESFTKEHSFLSIAQKITTELLSSELTEEQAYRICSRAFDFEPKLKKMDDQIQILELFHGPSCAFKDFGASFLSSAMEEYLSNDHKKAVILTATSGDTGSAVARAFYNRNNIDVVILYPSGRVSPLQEKQLTTLGGNIHALEVKGTFDDCQRMVKEAFTNLELKKAFNLTSANSINLGRLIPQSFYYIWAKAQLADQDVTFCVPSGNFGNLTAGIMASQWGMKVEHFLAATNRNDVVPEYLNSGEYQPRQSVQTLSNAMDVGSPSNFERLMYIYKNSHSAVIEDLSGMYISDKETMDTIQQVRTEKGEFLCPHTAVGYLASKRFLQQNPDEKSQVVSLGTAHPGKFLEVVKDATSENVPLPPQLLELQHKEKSATIVENTLENLEKFLKLNF